MSDLRDQLSMVLDKSLRANGVNLTRTELPMVVKDVAAFVEGLTKQPEAEEAPAVTVPALTPPPAPTGTTA